MRAQQVSGEFCRARRACFNAIYLPYFWQSSRFVLAPAALLGISAACSAVRSASWLRSQLRAVEGFMRQRQGPIPKTGSLPAGNRQLTSTGL